MNLDSPKFGGLLALAGLSLISFSACSEGMDPVGSGGAMTTTGGTAGSASGGAASGGAASGGAASGGAASGGAASGGAASGGAASGGAGTGGDDGSGGGDASGGAGTGGSDGGGEFTLTSAEFNDGDVIPDAHTCASPQGFMGAPSPSLAWSGAPAETVSFGLIFLDRTLVSDGNTLGYHSAFWNLPASVTELPVDFKSTLTSEGADVDSSFQGYLGPCPNFGSDMGNTDEYEFILYAFDTDSFTPSGTSVSEAFVQSFEDAAIAKTVLNCSSSAVGN